MEELYKIEFIEGEDVCRFDGELGTEEWWKNKCGIPGEIEIEDEYIKIEDILYLKSKDTDTVLKAIGTYYPPEEKYDRIANSGYGETQAWTRKSILGERGSYVIKDPENLKIKSFSEFKKDYPKFNKKEYQKLIRSLDNYYENLRNERNT